MSAVAAAAPLALVPIARQTNTASALADFILDITLAGIVTLSWLAVNRRNRSPDRNMHRAEEVLALAIKRSRVTTISCRRT
jgi:hypothetical protein